MANLFIFLVGGLTVAAGAFTVTRRNPVHAALAMLVALGGVAALMLGLRAPFLAAMQVLLYGGAIMVLFVFVLMLLTLREDEMGPEPPPASKLWALVAAVGTMAVLWYGVANRGGGEFRPAHLGEDFGSTAHFAQFLYTDYVVAFELVTVLVMAAIAGVICLARRPDRASLEGTRLSQRPDYRDPPGEVNR